MVANPRVNQVPVMIGGDGKEELHEFYAKYFLPQIPPDTEMVPVSRTIGQGRLVDEMVFRLHPHDPDGLDVARHPADRQAGRDSVAGGSPVRRRQAGARALVLGPGLSAGAAGASEPAGLPVVGAEGARSVLDRSIPLNELIRRAKATARKHSAALPNRAA